MALFIIVFFASIARGCQSGWGMATHIDTSGGVFGIAFVLRGDTLTDGVQVHRDHRGRGEDRMHSFTLRSDSCLWRFAEFPWRQLLGASTKKETKSDTEERERREDKLVLLASFAYTPGRQSIHPRQRDAFIWHLPSRIPTFATASVI
ncbi:uncharacterized protein GGS22DRAFT_5624 [Annulohypoxylon maeteangense]|uniref:uncharacterized protein n=1 Tax=Annulohypoxylon maeteangense TaxID=1927788 RepID=UPI0020080ED1|nr:uncharacterized protein GGS22DRAFT_5624 [Annulohypoxylon maeteangense]KAI0889891.1 hypothetical protein GGS22DRAFT_5624 [Annulohypoxylon maeteangense]